MASAEVKGGLSPYILKQLLEWIDQHLHFESDLIGSGPASTTQRVSFCPYVQTVNADATASVCDATSS